MNYLKKIFHIPRYIFCLVKRYIKKILFLGRQARKNRPTRTFDEFFAHIKSLGFSPSTIIDVGAARGTFSLHHAFPDAYFILFEPLSNFIPELEQLMSGYRGEIHQCALMSDEGEREILRTNDLFGSSLMHRVDKANDPRLQHVNVRTLDSVLRDHALAPPVILKTDCQGSDFEVLKGGTSILDRCDLLIVEVSFFRFWGPHHPDALEIFNFLNQKGFVIYDFLDGLFRPLDNALGQIDMVFVRRDGLFRKDHRWLVH